MSISFFYWNNENKLFSDKYIFKGRLYQIEKNLPGDFIMASRSAIINYRKLDHLKMLENGNIDAILENKIDVQISRRKIKNLKDDQYV